MAFPNAILCPLAGAFFLTVATSHALDITDLNGTEEELESLVSDWETQWKKDREVESSTQLALSLQALGMIERQAGKPGEAILHLEKACELLSVSAPANLLNALEAKALTLQDLGKLTESEQILRGVLSTRKNETEGLALAATLDHLALNLLFQGRYPEVATLLDEAEAAAPSDDAKFQARIASHRARLHHTLGSYARAETIIETALTLPFEDRELRLSLNSQLALSRLRAGKQEQALAGTEAAADEARELFKATPILAIPYLNNLGAVAMSQGETKFARSIFSEILETSVAVLGEDHPSLIGTLNNLGVAEQALGDYVSAKAHLTRASELQALHLPPIHLRVAETERNLARNSLLSGSTDAADQVSLATRTGLALLDKLISEGTEKERLNFLERFDLTSLPSATEDPQLIANVLIASKARLLDAMLSGEEEKDIPEWQDIQKTLSPGSAWVDTCRFKTISADPVVRYGAILILPTGSPQWIPLGTDESLASWLKSFRKRLNWQAAKLSGKAGSAPALKLRTILHALHREFWQPIAEKLPPGTQHIAFSPDSRLHFLPLPALLDTDNRPLATRHLQITTFTSARDLLNKPSETRLAENPWTVLTISDFPSPKRPATEDRLVSLLSGLQSMPGTRIEAKVLSGLAPDDSTFLTGSNASENNLHDLRPSPAVLHLGCHAFFLQEENPTVDLPIDFDEHSELLYSGGLVLYHGAERKPDVPLISPTDDLLFPSEIADLPLKGTRLVTLSSCESGVGTPVSGEGLLGLRRAFSIAGASEVAVALWPVSDDATPDFMQRFYQLALESDRPAQALWQTQGELLSAALDDEEQFELAVLRYAPFVISQNTPLTTGGTIVSSESHWKKFKVPILWSIPLLLFFIARLFRKKCHDSR